MPAATAYETPGLYWERLDAAGPVVSSARMDVAAFVGIARKGPLDVAVAVETLRQFEAHFGSFTGSGFLAYAVKGFFDNGGRRAWIVRAASRSEIGGAEAASAVVAMPAAPGAEGGPTAWRISASSPGVWGDALEAALSPETATAATSLPFGPDPARLKLRSTAGLARDALARLTQDGTSLLRIVAAVDPLENLVHFVHPDPRQRRASDRDVAPLDPSRPIRIETFRVALTARESGVVIGVANDLGLTPADPRYGPVVLGPRRPPASETAPPPAAPFPLEIEPVFGDPGPVPAFDGVGALTLRLAGGRDGLAALRPSDLVGDICPAIDEDASPPRGLQALARLHEPAIVAIPDLCVRPEAEPQFEPSDVPDPDPCAPCGAEPPTARPAPRPIPERPPVFSDDEIAAAQQILVDDCAAHRDRIALIDPPFGRVADADMGVAGLIDWRRLFDSKYAAFYAPWLRVVDPNRPGETRLTPPSGHVAGQYALAEWAEGVHRAPANRDLDGVEGVSLAIDPARHGLLNALGVNVVKPALGRRARILGARTLSSDPDARYVPVRRLVMFLIRSIDRATQWAVFEPNAHQTRADLTHGLTGFLDHLWRGAALAGDTADAAYAVRCDATNNPPSGRDAGQLVCEIAVAPVIPYEFVVLRIGRVGDSLEVDERTVRLDDAGGPAS